MKQYRIIINISTLRGKSLQPKFTGTKSECTSYAVRYIQKHHLAPNAVYLQEVL